MGDSNLTCGSQTVKCLVFFFNLLFFVCGFALVVIGAIAQGFFKEYIQFFEADYKSPAICIVVLGTIIMMVSFFGCCGAKAESVFMLRTFGLFLGLLLMCELAGGIAIAVLRNDIDSIIKKNMNETLYQYGNNDLVTSAWDDVQQQFSCCGTQNFTDWKNTTYSEGKARVPDSCCIKETLDCGAHVFSDPKAADTIFHDGCSENLKNSALDHLGAIVGAIVALALAQIMGLWMSCSLITSVKEQYESLA